MLNEASNQKKPRGHRERSLDGTGRKRRGRRAAAVFAALGDETRLELVGRLSGGEPLSIARLTDGMRMTRQAVTKHLGVLRRAGIVRGVRRGRENVFALEPEAVGAAKSALDAISRQWDDALDRLRVFVEES